VLAGGSVLAVIAVAVVAGEFSRLARAACRPPSPCDALLTLRSLRRAVSSFDRVVRK
jgi:hypothetical protein